MAFLLLAALFLGPGPLSASTPAAFAGPQGKVSAEAAEAQRDTRFDELVAEFQKEFLAWRQSMRGERDPAARRELMKRHPARVFEARFRELGASGETRGLVWVLQNATNIAVSEPAAFREAVCRTLIDEHTDSFAFGERGIDLILNEQNVLGVATTETLLRELAARTKVPGTRLKTLRRLAVYLSLVDEGEGSEGANARGIALFEQLVTEAEAAGEDKLARDLGAELIRRRDLRIGALAPDFEATTVDGETFRLSDFRGKIVLVDFWGFWCTTCRRELPHLKDVRDRYKDRDFVIVGVATDEDKDEFRRLAEELDVDWVNAWDGSTDGPLSRAWGVGFYPTSYLLDAEGRIRKANLRMQYLGLAVKQLLAEHEGAADQGK